MARVSGFDVTEEQKLYLDWIAKKSLDSNAAYFRAKIQADINSARKKNLCVKCSLPQWCCSHSQS